MRGKSTPLRRSRGVCRAPCGSWRRAFCGRRCGGRQRRGCALDRPVTGAAVGRERGGARGDVLLGTCVALACLTPRQAPRVAPGALQTCGEGVGARVAAVSCDGGAPGRVACAGQARAEHGQARHAAAVTADLGAVDGPVGAGRWPGLAAGGRGAAAGLALAQGGPSHPEVLGGTASAGEPPAGVACWAPRAVGASGLAAGQVVGVAGVAHVDGHTARCQEWAAGDSGHPRAVHDHGIDGAGVEPGG